jgi:hypothetical protein
MNRDDFLDTLRQQYAEDIREAYLECEHGADRPIDVKRLNGLLRKLQKDAKVDGLPGGEFDDLVRSTLPQICDTLSWAPVAAAATGRKAA